MDIQKRASEANCEMIKKKRHHTSRDIRRLYNDLSWTWPIISPPADYIEEGEKYKNLFNKYSKIPVSTLLNLGCGGGHVDWVMKKYFSITGIDISISMLKLAKKLNPDVLYKKGDMRSVRLRTLFDAVLIHDSVNYMLTERDLSCVFKTAYEHLKPGGMLLTFAEEYNKIEQHKISSSTHKKHDTEITFIEHYYDPDPTDTTFECTFIYLIHKNKKLDIQTDRHLGGVFNLKTWLQLLRKSGFKVKKMGFEHSSFPKGTTIPTFICAKPFPASKP
jgi:SAM-dependent methyltransferase